MALALFVVNPALMIVEEKAERRDEPPFLFVQQAESMGRAFRMVRFRDSYLFLPAKEEMQRAKE